MNRLLYNIYKWDTPKKYKNSRIEVIEMDELYTFISEKKTTFLNSFVG